jgi:pSer/pThr/pTyr-binding forkhead associated (FHA) protein
VATLSNDPDLSPVEATSAIPIVESFSGEMSAVNLDMTDLPDGSAVLLVIRGPQVGDQFVLTPAGVVIGRAGDGDLSLDDVTVSRKHAHIYRTNDAWFLEDLQSLNGSYVNRSRVDKTELSGGEEIQIGKYRFAFLLPLDRS